jgi:anti-anti-sigma regulatory factor
MPSSPPVGVREVGTARVLVPPRDLTGSAGKALTAAADAALEESPAVLVIEFSQVETLNSAGVGALFEVARRARERSVPVALAAIEGQPRLVVEQVRLPLYVPVHDSVEAAIASLGDAKA